MAKQYDLLIQGGLVVTGFGIRKADVGIKGEQILSVESGLPTEEASQVIDATGKYVMPGVIDVHVHPVYEDDMGGLSLTAAYGGTTTLIHFAYAKPGMKLIDTIKKYQEEGTQSSYLDFGIHGALFDQPSQI
jgi:dihydroorotase-like cyclic amidohydrolase